MMCRCPGSAGLSGRWGDWFRMYWVGEERNAYRHSFLWLVQYGTRGRCPSFCCKNFLVTFLIVGSYMSVLNCASSGHYWPKLHSVDWHYKLSIYCTYSPQVYRRSECFTTEAHHISKDPSPLSMFDCKTRKTSLIHEPTKKTLNLSQQTLAYAV